MQGEAAKNDASYDKRSGEVVAIVDLLEGFQEKLSGMWVSCSSRQLRGLEDSAQQCGMPSRPGFEQREAATSG